MNGDNRRETNVRENNSRNVNGRGMNQSSSCSFCKSCCNTKGENESTFCMVEDCKTCILCSQAAVSRCEAELFCEVVEKVICELHRSKNLQELKEIIDMVTCLFVSSAEKEKALAEILQAYCKCSNGMESVCRCK
ncbi:hypothetical protein [Anaeromicropila populeti]|uniref:Uncharacterized protein n=1 Tax=Anaeromicropila populeti TaxID=37658 RepID=A0A1I6IBU1_9FIRM|nr:hypothetical protein [Anaeromicropila populeti]SFR63850.1 hypothetical protein SAMN05661086_00635 [Anaeromicropila populeti]